MLNELISFVFSIQFLLGLAMGWFVGKFWKAFIIFGKAIKDMIKAQEIPK